MTKHNSKDNTKKNSKTMTKQNSKAIARQNTKSNSVHLTEKSENQQKTKDTFSQRNKIIKRSRYKKRGKSHNHKKYYIKRTLRWNNTNNSEVKNINIANNFISAGNINIERSLNISRAFSSDDHNALQFRNFNIANNNLRNNRINEINLNFNFYNPLNIDNNSINETSFDQNNDEELLDFSFIREISCNHFNRNEIEKNLFAALPKNKIEDISYLSYKECIICLNNFLKDEIAITLSCSHIFHSPCLEKWISQSTTCPLCRTIIGG